jgi:hypothetical protein
MTQTSLGEGQRLPLYPVEVLRLAEGGGIYFRPLCQSYKGLYTHWIKGRSELCDGSKCGADCKKFRKVWKGYAAIDYWLESKKLWIAAVLEITEAMDLDLKELWKRGQVWLLRRGHRVKGKHPPRSATLIEEVELSTLPHEFDIIPCLKNLYHSFEIDLSHDNPMPRKTLLPPEQGAAPGAKAREMQRKEQTPEERSETRKILEDFRKRHGINGKPAGNV